MNKEVFRFKITNFEIISGGYENRMRIEGSRFFFFQSDTLGTLSEWCLPVVLT